MEKSNCKDIVVAVTYQCNSRCRMCNIWQKNSPGILKAEDYDQIPSNLSNINITGGEPFLRSDLPQVLKVIHKRSPKSAIIISSNGIATELILEQVRKIKKIIPNFGIAISLDGIGRAHDDIRGVPGAFERIRLTISGLRNLGLRNLRLAFTLGDYNIEELVKVYDLSRDLGIEMTLSAVHSGELYFNATNPIIKKREMAVALDSLVKRELLSFSFKRWVRAYFAFGLKEFILTGKRILPDYSGKYNLFVDPDGDIYPCDISSRKIGSLRSGFDNLKSVCMSDNSSWMICTARLAIKKHWPKFILWLIKNNFITVLFYRDFLKNRK